MLAICAAFAAPLLSLTQRQSFGIHLFGRAKAGKTTTLLAGASVIGLGREADLPNWGATAAAKGESARMFNDMLFSLNEVGLLGGSKRKAYPEIRETIYRLGEGRERLRHTQSVFSAPAASSEVATGPSAAPMWLPGGFDPRSREGSDVVERASMPAAGEFRSTLPRRERRAGRRRMCPLTPSSVCQGLRRKPWTVALASS